MLSLLKIRRRQFRGNFGLFLIFHIILPGCIFLYALILTFKKQKIEPIIFPKTESYIKGEYYLFPYNDEDKYKNLAFYLDELAIISQDENECKALSDFIKNETDPQINRLKLDIQNPEYKCYKEEKELSNNEDAIAIINNNEKYEFKLIKHSSHNFFGKNLLSIENVIDMFNIENLNYTNETNYNVRYSVYLELQSLLAKYLIQKKGKNIMKNLKITVGTNRFPEHTNQYSPQKLKILSKGFYILIISLLFSLYSFFFSIRMIEEKEKKLDLFLKRYGASQLNYIFSWFITFLVLNIMHIINLFLIFRALYLYHSLLFLINICLYVLSLFSFSYFLYLCIPSVRAGYTFLKLFNFCSCIFGLALTFHLISRKVKIVFGLLPQVNVFYCTYSIFELQIFDKLSWDRLWMKANKISFMESIIIYAIDIFLYLFLSIIINLINCNCLFSCCQNTNSQLNDDLLNDIEIGHEELSAKNTDKKNNNQYLNISNISKTSDGLQILNDFSEELFSDEIYCLLGENGAGKTTLLNIISGVIEPNKNNGNITHNGISLLTNKKYIYNNIALCPQDNLFFEYLTVSEHLKLMQQLKSRSIDFDEINGIIKQFDLSEKEDYQCGTLSEGQKRKLCIALAFISKAEIILLDEPTSDMDIMSKKKFWKVLKNFKKDKIILITTHSLEEAELLGDRIGIMNCGKLLCSGTSSYLKEKYPCGFNVNILLNMKNEKYEDNIQKMINDISNIDNSAIFRRSGKNIISISLKSNNDNFSKVFHYIEESKKELDVENYLLSSTLLEDIFFKINNNKNNDKNVKIIDNNINEDADNIALIMNNKNNNMKSFCPQLFLEIKRILLPLKRNFFLNIFELIISLFGAIFLFFLAFKDWMIDVTKLKKHLNFFEVLQANKNYVFDKNDYLIKSYAYSSSKNIILEKIEKRPNNISEFIDLVYENSFANIAKGSLYINQNEQNNSLIDVYNTEINTKTFGNVFANTMLLVSSYLQNEYDIQASIITEINYIFTKNWNVSFYEIFKDWLSIFFICIFAIFGLIFLLTGFINQPMNERVNKVKRLIYLNGGNLWSYWISLFISDSIKLLFFTSFLMFSTSSVNSIGVYIWINVFLGSISFLVFFYFFSNFCTKQDSVIKAVILYVLTCLIIGFVFDKKITQSIVRGFNFTSLDLNPISSMILSCLRISFHYSMLPLMEKDTSNNSLITLVFWNGLCMQLINFIVYGLLLIFAECGYLRKIFHCIKKAFILKQKQYTRKGNFDLDIDADVGQLLSRSFSGNEEDDIKTAGISMGVGRDNEEEEIKLNDNNINSINHTDSNKSEKSRNSVNEPLLNKFVNNEIENIRNGGGFLTKIEGVKKIFWYCCKKNVVAVNNLYLGLELNEKIGLLGFNGSGKSIIFKMIVNELLSDSGDINIFGHNKSIIGYCPQENITFDYMTVKEIIHFFSGLNENKENAEDICNNFGLNKYLNTYYVNLSGGNKRKLALAISLINNPSLLLLDEPSSKLDPISRNNIYKNIKTFTKNSQRYNIILSSSSPEETDVLCDRISWFNKGNFTFLGKLDEMKKPFINIYKLYVKYNNKLINNNNINNDLSLNFLNETIKNFNIFTEKSTANPEIKPHMEYLYNTINAIKDDVTNIELIKIEINNTYEFNLEIKEDKKESLYLKIIELKNNYQQLSEISIGTNTLDNIISLSK